MALEIPQTMDDITPEWLTAVLRKGGVLTSATVVKAPRTVIGTGLGILGEIARITLEYDRPELGAPATVVAKIPTADPGGRGVAQMLGFYEKEVRFYNELAGRVTAPRNYYAAGDPASVRYVVLMEDLGNYRLGDQVAGCSVDEAELLVENVAALHAEWWESPALADLDWIPLANAPQNLLAQGACMMATEPFLQGIGQGLTERQVAIVKGMSTRMNAIQDALSGSPRTLCHGDLRLDNVFFGRDAGHHSLVFVDWQIALRGRGPYDLAYCFSQSMDPADRKANEERLLRDYHQRLLDSGVSNYSWDQCWDDYRAATLFCVAYPVVAGGQIDLGNERGVELARKMAQRSLTAAVELDVDNLFSRFEERPPFTG